MKSTVTFKEYFYKLNEDVTAGSALGGVAGFNPEATNINSAPYDERVPKGSKIIQTRKKPIKIKKRYKNKK